MTLRPPGMRIDVVSLFPDFIEQVVKFGIPARACEQNRLQLKCWDVRKFTTDIHRTVDDRPYGGGPGMVMKFKPLEAAINAAKAENFSKVVYLSPQGKSLTQARLQQASQEPGLILVAGRYEGIDERVVETLIDEEWSLGDYVLSGGELAAMVILDGIARLLPGVLGHKLSAQQDSFVAGLLDCPHYTRPEQIGDLVVPDVLLSGNHKAIEQWRAKQALERTYQRRPDLIEKLELTQQQQKMLEQYQQTLTDSNRSDFE